MALKFPVQALKFSVDQPRDAWANTVVSRSARRLSVKGLGVAGAAAHNRGPNTEGIDIMGWPTATEAEAVAAPAVELSIEERNARIQTWLDAKGQLEVIKQTELEARGVVTQTLFPDPRKGTQRYPLANGYAIKLVYGWNYKLGDKEKTDGDGVKISIPTQVDDLLERIDALGEQGKFIGDRLIKWTPELVVSEYEKLGESAVGLKIKELVDAMLVVTPATPQLTFEEPKAK